jgi:hypothetical protein
MASVEISGKRKDSSSKAKVSLYASWTSFKIIPLQSKGGKNMRTEESLDDVVQLFDVTT